MTTNHTPGPWKQGPQTHLGAEVMLGNGEYVIARCEDPDIEWATATLIAAAPELLAALRRSVEAMAARMPHCSVLPDARAAIAKAEGRP